MNLEIFLFESKCNRHLKIQHVFFLIIRSINIVIDVLAVFFLILHAETSNLMEFLN